jgi:hypothetical protein
MTQAEEAKWSGRPGPGLSMPAQAIWERNVDDYH